MHYEIQITWKFIFPFEENNLKKIVVEYYIILYVRFTLVQEIDRINRMDEEEVVMPLEEEYTRWMAQDSYVARPYGLDMSNEKPTQYIPDTVAPTPEEVQPLPSPKELAQSEIIPAPKLLPFLEQEIPSPEPTKVVTEQEKKKTFALTPLDKEYFEPEDKIIPQRKQFIFNYFIKLYYKIAFGCSEF